MNLGVDLKGLTVLSGRYPREQKTLCDSLSNLENAARMAELQLVILSRTHPPDALVPAIDVIKSALREMGAGGMELYDNTSRCERAFGKLGYVLENWRWYSKVHDLLVFESPEAYLHPHYQNALAEALVLAVKGGVRVFVETNGPEFMLALDTMARRHEIFERVHFYHAERANESAVTYRDVTDSPEVIYKDFVEPMAKMDVLMDKYADYGREKDE